LLAEY
jgi:hypothetical protein